MRKRLFCLLLVLWMLPFSCFAEAAIAVTVDGIQINFAQAAPYQDGGALMLPVRATGKALGYDVRWNENSRRVVLDKADSVITAEVGAAEIYCDGERKTLDASTVMKDGTVYISAAFITGALGLEAVFENNTLSVQTGAAQLSEAGTKKMNGILQNITGSTEFDVKRPVDNGIVVDVTEYGASPGNTPAKNIEAFEQAIAAVKEKGAWKLNIPNGEYRLGGGKKYAIELFDVSNLRIEGNGATLIFSQHTTGEANGAYFGVERTDTVELCNITLDWDWDLYPLFAIGKVCAVDQSAGTIEFEIDSGLSECSLADNLVFGGGCGFDPKTNNKSDMVGFQFPGGASTVKEIKRTAENKVQLTYSNINYLASAVIGEYGFLYFRTPQYINGFRMAANKHLTFDNIEVNSAPYQIIYSNDTEYFQIVNSRFQPKPESGRRFVSYGGLEVHSVDGYFKLENCVVDGVCDDTLHLSNHFFGGGADTGNPKIDDRTVMLDYLQLWMAETDIYEGAKFVCASKQFELYDWESTIESFEWELNVYSGSSQHRCKVTFKDPLPADYDDFSMFWNADKFTGNYIIRGNTLKNGMCHGMYLGIPNGTVENNIMDNFGYPTLVLHSVVRWGRWYIGTPIDNVIIRGNTMTHNNTARRDPAAFFIGGGYDNQPSNYFPVEGRITSNVLAENNVVDGSTWAAFGLFSAKNIVVRNNQFLNANALPTKDRFKGMGSAYVANCDDIVLVGNKFENGAGAYEEGLFVDDTTTTGIVAENNTGIGKVTTMADLVATIEQDVDENGNLVVDVGSYGYSETGGSWSDSTRAGYSTVTRQSSSSGACVQWKPLLTAGTYKVFIYKVAYPAAADNEAKITVQHKNGVSEFTLDYTDGTSGFVELGTFEFEEGNHGYVQNMRTRGTARASAVMFQKVAG